MDGNKKQTAGIISCFDKKAVCKAAEIFNRCGLVVLASAGTSKVLLEKKINCISIEKYTGQKPGCLSKTLQYKIHEGLLVDQRNKRELIRIKKEAILPVRVVYSNIYPYVSEFTNRIKSPTASMKELIDIGGPAMIMSAVRNYRDVFVIIDSQDLDDIETKMSLNQNLTLNYRKTLALKALKMLLKYYSCITMSFKREI